MVNGILVLVVELLQRTRSEATAVADILAKLVPHIDMVSARAEDTAPILIYQRDPDGRRDIYFLATRLSVEEAERVTTRLIEIAVRQMQRNTPSFVLKWRIEFDP